eukprot:15478211-Alexandrium_andersonii.AAC.1
MEECRPHPSWPEFPGSWATSALSQQEQRPLHPGVIVLPCFDVALRCWYLRGRANAVEEYSMITGCADVAT